jgi:hypothetical protein
VQQVVANSLLSWAGNGKPRGPQMGRRGGFRAGVWRELRSDCYVAMNQNGRMGEMCPKQPDVDRIGKAG